MACCDSSSSPSPCAPPYPPKDDEPPQDSTHLFTGGYTPWLPHPLEIKPILPHHHKSYQVETAPYPYPHFTFGKYAITGLSSWTPPAQRP
eukprot:766649-Hanusia_phi.AAC.5